MDELENAPMVGPDEFRRLAFHHGNCEAEQVSTAPLVLEGGSVLLRSKPGRGFVRASDGAIVAVLNPDLA